MQVGVRGGRGGRRPARLGRDRGRNRPECLSAWAIPTGLSRGNIIVKQSLPEGRAPFSSSRPRVRSRTRDRRGRPRAGAVARLVRPGCRGSRRRAPVGSHSVGNRSAHWGRTVSIGFVSHTLLADGGPSSPVECESWGRMIATTRGDSPARQLSLPTPIQVVATPVARPIDRSCRHTAAVLGLVRVARIEPT
jgi:hypothetical protein